MKKFIIIFTVLISMLCFSSCGTQHEKVTPAVVNTTELETSNSSTSGVSVTFEGSEKTEDSLKTKPENAVSRTSKSVNIEGDCAVQDGRIYYANHFDDGTLYSMNIDGSDNRKLNDDLTPWFYVSGDRIYYENGKGGNIYVMNADGSGNKKLNEDNSVNINIFGNRIYYLNWDDNSALYSMNTDGSDRKKLSSDELLYMNVVDNRIYYFCEKEGLKGIYSANTDGSDKIKLTDDIPYRITVADGWIYYNNEKDSNKLYAIRTDGSDRHKLIDDYALSINVAGDQIYYIKGDEWKFYRVNKDGSNRKLLSEDSADWICVFNNRIYYTMSGAKIYSMDTDGGDIRVIKDLSDGAYKEVTYEITSRLSEDMPEFRFVATGKTRNTLTLEEWGMGYVMGLEVYDEKDRPLLKEDYSYSDLDEVIGNYVYNNMMDTMGLHVTDVNFDGYKDVIILNSFSGAHSNTLYDCWLWNQKTSSFVKSESFSDICNPALNPEKKCIYSSGGSGASHQVWEIYQYIDGKFVVTNNLSYVENNEGYHFTEQNLVNGKMKTLRDDLIKAGNFNDALSAAGYIGDKVWQLDNPRWYMFGGHHADQWLE